MVQATHIRTAAVIAAMLVAGLTPPAAAQRGGGAAAPAQGEAAAEIQRLFGAYAVLQAQEALGMSDEQFARFLPRMRALQEARRRGEVERMRLTGELARLTAPGVAAVDEAGLKSRLKALAELEERTAAEVRSAYDALDQTLDVRQQARFRVFELQLERRKLELMLRARRGEAGRPPR